MVGPFLASYQALKGDGWFQLLAAISRMWSNEVTLVLGQKSVLGC